MIDQEKSALLKSPSKSASSRSERSKRVDPQPFSFSTQRSSEGNGVMTSPSIKEKSGDKSSISPASMTKKVWPSAQFSLKIAAAYIISFCFESNLIQQPFVLALVFVAVSAYDTID